MTTSGWFSSNRKTSSKKAVTDRLGFKKAATERQGSKKPANAPSADGEDAPFREMTAARRAREAVKEAALAEKSALLAAQKQAREEHERAIVPQAAKPVRREQPLRRPRVVVRVRPLAQSGGHSNDGAPVSKRLASWDNGCVVLEDEVGLDSGSLTGVRSQKYSFAETVLGPDAKQVEVHNAAADDLVRAVCIDGFNGLLFAYGQTGTGKTHTIFGPMASWKSIRHEESGILPRAVAAMLDTMRSREASTSSVLTASCLEFYMSSCLDLLDDASAPCLIGPNHRPLGLLSVPIDNEQACVDFMARVRERRHTRATLMNAASDGHDGSSRSHCAMILTLRQLDRASGSVLMTELNVVDMAGAERPNSVQSTLLAMWDAEKGGEPTIAGQGLVINFELSQLRTAVVQATEQHLKGLPVINAKTPGTEFIEFAKGCFDCSALLSMIVTLSPARSCGWETWFSCTYGEDLQRLRCPVQPQKAKDLSKLIAATELAIQRLSDEKASEAAANDKYVRLRAFQLRHETQQLEQLQRLAALAAEGKSGTTEEGGACVVS